VSGVVSDYLLALPVGCAAALIWANPLPDSYYRFAHATSFWVNDVGMVFFFALITKEVAEATLKLRPASREEIEQRTRVVAEKRRGALPGEPNAGSIFKNPRGDYAGRLIEACGLKGERRGDAEISTRHANVIVNHGQARSADVLELMRLMRDSVSGRFGVTLSPEVEFLGLTWD